MKNIVCNPYLPLNEYIPDAEPRLFNDRVYIYGSHDAQGGNFFCTENYTVWSASKNNLCNWRFDGESYKRGQDPSDLGGELQLFAPDVVQGADGRYYLYYCLKMRCEFGVAVSKTPEGPFSFYGHVKNSDGTVFCEHMPYDPSVLCDDDGRIYLYYGFSSEILSRKFNTEISPGAMVIELLSDMLTVCSKPKMCVPWKNLAVGTDFEGHAYFEAPSMRKLFGKYYLVYSSEWCHELCYAVSEHPTFGFKYGGILVDNGGIGENNRRLPVCAPGNNHGGLLLINNDLYIFYHRHTHANSFSRQGCAEKLSVDKNGVIKQAEITSCGLYAKPLPATGKYSASIACCLYGENQCLLLDFRQLLPEDTPHITHSDNGQVICNISNKTVIGYKYFKGKANGIWLVIRGRANGVIVIACDEKFSNCLSTTKLSINSDGWETYKIKISFENENSLFIKFLGEGKFSFKEFEFI